MPRCRVRGRPDQAARLCGARLRPEPGAMAGVVAACLVEAAEARTRENRARLRGALRLRQARRALRGHPCNLARPHPAPGDRATPDHRGVESAAGGTTASLTNVDR